MNTSVIQRFAEGETILSPKLALPLLPLAVLTRRRKTEARTSKRLRAALPAVLLALGLGLAVPMARADFDVDIDIDIGDYPQMVVVPGYPVYYDPYADYNYFYYDGLYWIYIDDAWYSSNWYAGPWSYVDPYYVPAYILRVPVYYYRDPPRYFREWREDAPPRWGARFGTEWTHERRGWDHWNRAAVPRPAPLPSYQRNFGGDRYPREVQQQRQITTQFRGMNQGWHEAPRRGGQNWQQRPENRGQESRGQENRGQPWEQRQDNAREGRQQRPEAPQAAPQWQQRQENPHGGGQWQQYPQQSQEWQRRQPEQRPMPQPMNPQWQGQHQQPAQQTQPQPQQRPAPQPKREDHERDHREGGGDERKQ